MAAPRPALQLGATPPHTSSTCARTAPHPAGTRRSYGIGSYAQHGGASPAIGSFPHAAPAPRKPQQATNRG